MDHGPLTVMVRTDEGVRFWGSGELVGAASDQNTTQNQVDVINQQERGFRLNYTLTPC